MAMVIKKINPLVNILIIASIVLVILLTFLPYFWMFLSSFKTRADLLSTVPRWIFTPTLDNFPEVFIERDFLKYFVNSLIIGVSSLVLSLLVGVPCAYAISRFQMPGKGHFFVYVLSTRMAPGVAFALPMYILFSKMGILGSHMAVILAHITLVLSFVIWIMKGFFDDLPIELEQAAMVDGYTVWGAFWHVILPIVKPGIVATSLFGFIFSWNEFLFALVLGGSASRTLPAAFPGLVTPHGTFWAQMSAAGTVVTVPIIILAIVLQKHLVRGLSFGAVKN
jgi:multiple sugar transport system permease protein